MQIYLKNEILKDERITNEGRFVYMGLRCLNIRYDYRNREFCEDIRVIHPKTIFYFLMGELRDVSKKEREVVYKGIMNLAEMELISVISENNDFYVVDVGGLYMETAGYFINVVSENIRKIFVDQIVVKEKNVDTGEWEEREVNPNRYNLCALYLIMLATVNNARHYGTIAEKVLAEMAWISPRSVVSFIYYLELFELIYVYRSTVKVNRLNEDGMTNELVNLGNIYGEYWKRGAIQRAGERRDQELLEYGDGVEGRADARGIAS